jgi:hypothetical protein
MLQVNCFYLVASISHETIHHYIIDLLISCEKKLNVSSRLFDTLFH